MYDVESKDRLRSIDTFKGFIIIAVVFLHVIFSKHSDAGSPGIFIQAFYLGLMAFFIMSGYFYRPGRGFKANMMKRVKQLFVAIALCAIVLPVTQYGWLAILGQAPGFDDYVLALQWGFGMNELFAPLGSPKVYPICGSAVGYYFLWAMLVAFVIFYAVIDHVIKDNRKLAAVIVILLVITALQCEFGRYRLPFFAELAPLSSAFMFFGAAIAKYDLVGKVEAFAWKDKRYWGVFILSLICAAVLLILFPPGINFDILILGDHGGLSVFPYYVESFCMFIVFLYICNLISRIPGLVKVFTELGEHTMGILLYHGFVASVMMAVICPLTSESWFPADLTMMQRIPLAFATLIICFIICRFGPVILRKVSGKAAKKEKAAGE